MTRRDRTSVVGFAVAIALIAVLALALPAVGEAAGTGAIAGTVTGEGAGDLQGVEVCAEEVNEEGFGCETTDSAGGYEISGLAEGEYKVAFWPQGNYLRQFYADKSSWSTATPVQVTASMTKSGIDAVLEKGATISGVVTAAATGQPSPGVEVCAFSEATESFGCAETNGAGSYTIIGLSGGQFEVYFFPEGNGQGLLAQSYSLGLVTVAAHGETKGINQALQPGGQITGVVRLAATNAPLAGVRVCLSEAEFAESLGCLTTPASGAYRFYGLRHESYKVAFSAESSEIFDAHAIVDSYPTQWWNGQSTFAAATPIAVTPPAIVSGIEAHLGPPPPPAATPVVVPTPVPTKVKSKAIVLKCKRAFVKRKVRGKLRCVKRHKAASHHRRHRKTKSA